MARRDPDPNLRRLNREFQNVYWRLDRRASPPRPNRRLSRLPWLPLAMLLGAGAVAYVMSGAMFDDTGLGSAGIGSGLVGIASVIDGDTIEIHGTRIRLTGIDAPEPRQFCEHKGEKWLCGQAAGLALAGHIAGRTVDCRSRGTDRYGRTRAVCLLGSEDLNGWLVSQGWAMAYRYYSTAYVSEENAARAAKRGIWTSVFIAPWDWRHQH